MKTTIEINGYEITIEENEGVITVKAEKDEEVVEEFSINIEESEEGEESQDDDSDIKGFDEFGGDEEKDFEDEEGSEEKNEEDEVQDEEEAFESFQTFINKRKK